MKHAQIALRNLSRQKKRSFFIAFAIGIGVFFVLLINAFLSGTVRNIKENVADLIGGHIFITTEHQLGNRVAKYMDGDDKKVIETLKSFMIRENQFRRSITSDFDATMKFGNKVDSKWYIGVDFDKDTELLKTLALTPEELNAVRADEYGVIISKKAAKDLKVELGDSVLAEMKTYSGQNDRFEMHIRAILPDESSNVAGYAWVQANTLRTMRNLPGANSYTSLVIKLDSVDMMLPMQLILTEELKKSFPVKDNNKFAFTSPIQKIDGAKESFSGQRLEITSLSDFLANLDTFALALQGFAFFIMLVLMAIVFIGIWNTFKMIFFERIVEIGTIRAIGMQQNKVRSMILYEASFLSTLGFFVGLILAIIAAIIMGAIDLGGNEGADFLLNKGHLNFRFEPFTLISILGVIIGFTLLAALGPARKAAKLSPSAALRTAN